MKNALVAVVVAVLLAGCAAIRITDSWSDPSATGGYRKVLVVGMTRDLAMRRSFEAELAQQLKARGSDAVPSFTVIPEGAPVNEANLRQAVAQTHADAVLTASVLRVSSVETPPLVASPPRETFYGAFGTRLPAEYMEPKETGFRVFTLESTLYDVSTAKPAWRARTEASPFADIAGGVRQLSGLLLEDLSTRKLLAAKSR